MENKNMKKYVKPTYEREDIATNDIILISNGTKVEKGDQDGLGIISAAMSYILGF